MVSDKIPKSQTSAFGLYKYDECDDFAIKKCLNRRVYFIILITTAVILSSVCLIIYNNISGPGLFPLTPIANVTPTESTEEGRIHLSYSKEIINIINNSDSAPHALEVRNVHPIPQRRESDAPRPFFYEIRDPVPAGFVPDTRKRQNGKNIQEIIKYLNENPTNDNRKGGIKRPKASPKRSQFAISDPFFPYKPQNPSDINLLSTTGLRFAPTVQIEVTTSTETYPNYEVPETPKKSKKKLRSHKNVRQNPYGIPFVNNYANPYVNPNINPYNPYGNDLYSHNNFQQTRFQANRQLPYWNRPQNFGPQYFGLQHFGPQNVGPQNVGPQNLGSQNIAFQNVGPQKLGSHLSYQNVGGQNVGFQQLVPQNVGPQHLGALRNIFRPNSDKQVNPSQMILNLNLYPKKKLKENRVSQENRTEGSNEHESKKNITELQKLLQQLNNDNTFIQDEPESNTFKYLQHPTEAPETYEILKSIVFTVLNPNNSIKTHNLALFEGQESQWHPLIIETTISPQIQDSTEFSTEINTPNTENDETITLPMPYEEFERYFTTRATPKFNPEWAPDILERNPNLVNHKAYYKDKRRRKEAENE